MRDVALDGGRTIGGTMASDSVPRVRPPSHGPAEEIRFVRGSGGVRIAYAMHGSGPPLIVVSCWLSHLQHDWQSPVWRHFLEGLGSFSRLIRFDERGFGMSERNVGDFSLDARLGDLEALVAELGFTRFALLGMSHGSGVAMAYAARHPDRVTRLILYGTVCGEAPDLSGEAGIEEETNRGMVRIGWAREEPRFRRFFTQAYIPDATEEQMRWFDELQRVSTSADNYLAARAARLRDDISDELAGITAPTLIMHAVGDRQMSFQNASTVAALVPDARVVPLASQNHILLGDEPAWSQFVAEARAFLEPDRLASTAAGHDPDRVASLSERELEVLRLAAGGQPNADIAATLGLSIRTVERHLSNAYGKLGVSGPAARTAAVAELLRTRLA
jgi:pimeloyl-ACP methyl ester carboxylesterase/DNA-binding CsgD family transcriptional regulator